MWPACAVAYNNFKKAQSVACVAGAKKGGGEGKTRVKRDEGNAHTEG